MSASLRISDIRVYHSAITAGRKTVHDILVGGQSRRKGQKCGGRKSYAEANPELVTLARQLAAERLSLRKISTELAARGYATARSVAYSASAVKAMLETQRG